MAGQVVHHADELVGVDRSLQVEIEHELELPVGEGAALQLDQVQAQGIEPGQDLVQGAGPVGGRTTMREVLSAPGRSPASGDADEPGVVVAPVLMSAASRSKP